MKTLRWTFPLTLAITLLLTGCETPNPPSADDPTAQAAALERYATALAFDSVAEQADATRQAAEFQAQQRYAIITAEAQMTAEAHRREMEQQWQWATQQAANATQVAQATAQALAIEATRQALNAQATATERAFIATSTADALNQAATATAQYKADLATATHAAWEARTTATAESWQATQMSNHATMTRQAEKREEVLGYGRDYGIPIHPADHNQRTNRPGRMGHTPTIETPHRLLPQPARRRQPDGRSKTRRRLELRGPGPTTWTHHPTTR